MQIVYGRDNETVSLGLKTCGFRR